MKLYTNTYKQDKNFKDKVFSKGEDMTSEDLEIVKSRTTTYYVRDEEYEKYMSEQYTSFIPEATVSALAYGDSLGERFKIGNNLPSAE